MASEGRIEPSVRHRPVWPSLVESFPTEIRQMKLLAPAVRGSLNAPYETISRQRKDIPAKGCPVHDQNVSKTIDGQGAASLQLGEDRELRNAQP
jgi:hypothetical protein